MCYIAGLTGALAEVEESAKVVECVRFAEYCEVEGSSWRRFGGIMLMTENTHTTLQHKVTHRTESQ